jgi:hypothetical protein
MIVIRCKMHPKYKALRKPQVACFSCWFLWKIREIINNPDSSLEEVKDDKGSRNKA